MGSSLERKEGFYFRHDSKENPSFNPQAFLDGIMSPRKMMNLHPL